MPSPTITAVGASNASSLSSPEKKSPPKAKRPRLSVTIEMPEGNDRFCWKCHAEEANVPCTTCQRSFHEYCVPPPSQLQQLANQLPGDRLNAIGSNNVLLIGATAATGKSNKSNEASDQTGDYEQVTDLHNFVCTECLSVIRAERDRREGRQRGPLDKLDKQHLAELLLVAVRSIRPYALEVFHAPVSLEEYPDYKDFVVKPFDLQQLEQLVTKQRYSSVEEFVSDLKWIHHNSVVYNGPQNRISSSAVAMLKAADKEIGEMSLCPQCYLHMRKATTAQNQSASPASGAGSTPAGGNGGFFSEVCSPPHIIVWAKIRGFPHWPAKVMRVEGDQVTVKFFGDHNKSLVTLGNCTLLTLKPPVNQKSKKGSYSTAMDEMSTYVRKYRERFGVEFRYETNQIKLTTDIYEERMNCCTKEDSRGSDSQQSTLTSEDQGNLVDNSRAKASVETATVASGQKLETTAPRREDPAQPADNTPTAVSHGSKQKESEVADTVKTDVNKGVNVSTPKAVAGSATTTSADSVPPVMEALPMDVDEDEEGEEERRIKSVIISQVPLLAENDDDDKDSGSEEQNSILESIKRKLNLDKKSDSTDDDKEENGNGKDSVSPSGATEASATTTDNNNSSMTAAESCSSKRGTTGKAVDSNVLNNNISDNNNTDAVKVHNDVTPDVPVKDFKPDVHPDVQLQQMQAAAVIAKTQGRHQNHSSDHKSSSSKSGNNIIKNERKGGSQSGASETNPEKPQRETRLKRDHQQQQSQLKNNQHNCAAKEEKEDNGSSNRNSGSSAKDHERKDRERSALANAGGSSGKRESSKAQMNSNNVKANMNSCDLTTGNGRQQSQQESNTRVRGARGGAEPQEGAKDLESPASPPSTVPLVAGLIGGVEDANILAAAAAAAAAAGQQQQQQGKPNRAGGSGHFRGTNKDVLAGGILGLGVTGLLGVEDTPKSPERTNCCAEVSSTTADTDPPQTHPANANNQSAVAATTTVIPKVASGDTFFEKLRQTIEECKEKVGVTGHLNAQLQPIAGGVIGAHPEDEDQEDEEGHDYDESETDVSDTELMPYQQKALQLPSPRKESTAPPGEEAGLLSLASSQRFTHRETQTGDIPAHSMNWTGDDWALHYWNAPRVHPDDKRLNQELVAREMCLLKDKLKLKELAAHKALWQASATRMTDVVKSKQWCCVCKGLATMTCCWNTSYCSQACQSSHWPVHIKTCERSQQPSKR